MLSLNAAALLAAWETGLSQGPLDRGLTLLAAAWPEVSAEDWAHVSIGVRDGRLLALREALFGPEIEAVAVCPKCDERIEIGCRTNEISAPAPEFAGNGTVRGIGTAALARVAVDGYEVSFRLPTSDDLLKIACPTADGGRETLLQRCVESARRDGADVPATALPPGIVRVVTDEMARLDPQADVQLALACPVCQHRWSLAFDILSYLWSEIEDWARHVLRDVHVLAAAHGWSEREILAMSPLRRRMYLEIIGS